MVFKVEWAQKRIDAELELDGSKSISNRVLILQALSKREFPIYRLCKSEDTTTLQQLLNSEEEVLDVGPAGTTFRFLTAYLNTQESRKILTGSERMKQRPIGPLVDALLQIGADISYLEKEGYPPLEIRPSANFGNHNKVKIKATVSSQFITALLLIGSSLPQGLIVELVGELVSPSYLQMTIDILRGFGANISWKGSKISIGPRDLGIDEYTVEADWSGASYHYLLASLANEVNLHLVGLQEKSMQGDAAVKHLMTSFGIRSEFTESGVMLINSPSYRTPFEYDFTSCPDIAQTMAVTCAAHGVDGRFSGVQTLSIKETDRIHALRIELEKLNCEVKSGNQELPEEFSVSGKVNWNPPVQIDTYHDHRMAMSFAPLGILDPIEINDPKVVGKSYVDFWKHLTQLGAKLTLLD